jgi:hypothetical protein
MAVRAFLTVTAALLTLLPLAVVSAADSSGSGPVIGIDLGTTVRFSVTVIRWDFHAFITAPTRISRCLHFCILTLR